MVLVALHKKTLIKEMLAELRYFEQHAMPERGEEILNVMNRNGQWGVMKGPELIAQLQIFPKGVVNLPDYMVRNFRSPHTGRKFKRITIMPTPGTWAMNSDVNCPSRIEFCFGTIAHGFSYVMPEEVWTRLKPQVLQHVELRETEFGKHTRFDAFGQASNKKGKRGKKSRK